VTTSIGARSIGPCNSVRSKTTVASSAKARPAPFNKVRIKGVLLKGKSQLGSKHGLSLLASSGLLEMA